MIQRYLQYFPFGNVNNPAQIGLSKFKNIDIKTEDGEKILAWFHKKENSVDVIVYFHGNAGNLENRKAKYFAFAENSNYSILAVTYRGYPGSSGAPSEKGFYLDAEAAISYLKDQGYKDQNIILYGESIGSGVATEMATRINAKALILESPFTSIEDIAKKRYWFLPVSLMLKDKFDNQEKLQKLNLPILIIHGKKDRVVPVSHGIDLAEGYFGPKKLVITEDHGHMGFTGDFLIKNINTFMQNVNNKD
ncbi:MAG: alpha/beta hydrolase [Rickettsiales bacterium]|nr:alpha/beta hydrolase [Rickettsiales bacterium]